MNRNEQIYLNYLRQPTTGLMDLYNISKHQLIDRLERDLEDGIVDASLFDGLFEFYRNTALYDFNAMHYELSTLCLSRIMDYELERNTVIDKERLHFLRALLQISASNTIGAMASWELANLERQRTTGVAMNVSDLIDRLPEATIVNPVNLAYVNNPFVANSISKYPSVVETNLKNVIASLPGIDAISLLSCGLRNVQAVGLLQLYGNSLELIRIFAQEIVNSLCILCESTLKNYGQVSSTIPRKKDRQIGRMLSPATLGVINPAVSSMLGTSIGGYTGLYQTEQLMDDLHFNTAFPQYINKLLTNTFSIPAYKAHVLLGIHALRNRVLHDNDETLCFYSHPKLFVDTIGLLFAGISVTMKL